MDVEITEDDETQGKTQDKNKSMMYFLTLFIRENSKCPRW